MFFVILRALLLSTLDLGEDGEVPEAQARVINRLSPSSGGGWGGMLSDGRWRHPRVMS